MLRLVSFLVAIIAAAFGLTWLGRNPGDIAIDWQGHVITTTVFRAVIMALLSMGLVIALWSLARGLWRGPATVGHFMNRRREKRGYDAISSGLIAIGSGDRDLATRAAVQARKALPNQPLTHILRAQAAQLSGDRATARRIFEAMLQSPDTEQLGLRGLFLEAGVEKETEAARHYATRALDRNPRLEWPVEALFDLQAKASDWDGALDTLAIGRRQGTIERPIADRRRAVLLTAQAQAAEDAHIDKAQALAVEAHGLAPDLVPAAAIAGRTLAARGSTRKAAGILRRTWQINPHPDLAAAYSFARPGDSTADRLKRIRELAGLTPSNNEGPLALAEAAMASKSYDEARMVLAPLLLPDRLTQRVAKLMARLESEQYGNAGAVREWIARAVNAPRDPAWTADGIVAEHWAPLSPKTQTFDSFTWKVPVAEHDGPSNAILNARLDELVALGARHHVLAPSGAATLDAAPVGAAMHANGRHAPSATVGDDKRDWANVAASAADTMAAGAAAYRTSAPAGRATSRAATTVDDFIDDAVVVTAPADKAFAAAVRSVTAMSAASPAGMTAALQAVPPPPQNPAAGLAIVAERTSADRRRERTAIKAASRGVTPMPGATRPTGASNGSARVEPDNGASDLDDVSAVTVTRDPARRI